MISAIDHIVIGVDDLAAAVADYAAAGFTVTPGGQHTGGETHNALISFADGAYLELIAFTDPSRRVEHRWWDKLAGGEGFLDYALRSDGLVAEADRLRQAGLAADGPRDGGRLRPDGQAIAWRTLQPEAPVAALPFVIEDVTARGLRVPPDPATKHGNGVRAVAGLIVAVDDLDAAIPPYATLLGTAGDATPAAGEGMVRAHRFALGDQWVELAEPAAGADDIRRHLRERGAAPWEMVLVGPADAPVPANLAHRARVRIAAG